MRRTALLLLTIAVVLTGCGLFPAEEVEQPIPLEIPPEPERVVFTVRRGTIQDQVRLTGRVASQREAALYFRSGGRVLQVSVKPGDQVRSGQVLAVLDAGDLDVRLKLAELSLRQARLREEQVLEQAALKGEEAVKYDLAFARIEVERQQILYDQLRDQMEATVLTAPFDGLVTAVSVRPGDQVQGLTPVIFLADPEALEVRTEVATDETLAKLGLNGTAQLTILSGTDQREAEGRIVGLPDPTRAPAPGERAREVRIAFEGPVPDGTELGDLVQITVVVREARDALIIPNAAIRSYAGRIYVNLLEGDAKREVDIQLGIQTETESQVLKGLEEGQQVIGR